MDKGSIHFSSVLYLRNLEKSGNTFQGDSAEFTHRLDMNGDDYALFVRILGSNDAPVRVPFSIGAFNVRNKLADKLFVASFVLIQRSDLEVLKSPDKNIDLYKLKEDVLTKLKPIANGRPFVIFSFREFVQTVNDFFDSHGTGACLGQVSYKDYSADDFIFDDQNMPLDDFIMKYCFTKRTRYSGQKEYRIITTKKILNEFSNIDFVPLKNTQIYKRSGTHALEKLTIQIQNEQN